MTSRTAHRIAVAAAAASIAYLLWRATDTLDGAAAWAAAAFLVLEVAAVARFVAICATSDSGGPDGPAVTLQRQRFAVIVPAPAGTTVDDLTRTLLSVRALDANSVHVAVSGERRDLVNVCRRHLVQVTAVEATAPAALVAAVLPDVAESTAAWVTAGDIALAPLANLTGRIGGDTIVVQARADLFNRDSLAHLATRDGEDAVVDHVTAPARGRRGATTWTGSGSVFDTAAALSAADVLAAPSGGAQRAAIMLAASGFRIEHDSAALIRKIAPDTLAEYTAAVRSSSSTAVALLRGPGSVFTRGITFRARVGYFLDATAPLEGACRAALLALIAAVVVTGAEPLSTTVAGLVLVAAATLARPVVLSALSGGTSGFGVATRVGLRRMGAEVAGVLSPNGTSSPQLRLLLVLTWAVAGATLLRAASTFGLVDVGSSAGAPLALFAAAVALYYCIGTLGLVSRRVQRRAAYRVNASLPATVNGASASIVDATPTGFGVRTVADVSPGDHVSIEVDIPRQDGTTTSAFIGGACTHLNDGVAGFDLDPLTIEVHEALVEMCSLGTHTDDDQVDSAPSVVDLATATPGRRLVTAVSVTALAVAAFTIPFAPAASAASKDSVVTGNVTSDKGRVGEGEVCVWVHSGPSHSGSATDADGNFSIYGLTPGEYVFAAGDCRKDSSWVTLYNGSVIESEATPVVVGSGREAPVNFKMVTGARFEGNVAAADGNPVEGVCVSAVDVDRNDWLWVGTTDSRGSFSQTLRPGNFKVSYRECSGSTQYAEAWWPAAVNQNDAKVITAKPGDRFDVSAQLELGATVYGFVAGPDGSPLAGACVSIVDTADGNWNWQAGSQTDRDGRYTLVTTPGTFSVWVDACDNTSELIGSFQPPDAPSKDPARHELTAGSKYSFDAKLAAGFRASGRLTDLSGKPVAGACVGITDGKNGYGWGTSDADGNYSAGPAPAGTYMVVADGCGQQPWVTTFYPGTVDYNAAKWVELGANIDGLDMALTPAVRVSGTITSPSGDPLSNVCISVASDDRSVLDMGYTDERGNYFDLSIPAGNYEIVAVDCEPGRGHAATTLLAGELVGPDVNLSAAMGAAAPASITGTLLTPAGAPLAGACVVAYVPSDMVGLAQSGPDGQFSIDGLGAGRYWLGAFNCVDPEHPVVDPSTGAELSAGWYGGANLGWPIPDPVRDGGIAVDLNTYGAPSVQFCLEGCGATEPDLPTEIQPVPEPEAPTPTAPPVAAPADGTFTAPPLEWGTPRHDGPSFTVPPTTPAPQPMPPLTRAAPPTVSQVKSIVTARAAASQAARAASVESNVPDQVGPAPTVPAVAGELSDADLVNVAAGLDDSSSAPANPSSALVPVAVGVLLAAAALGGLLLQRRRANSET